MRFPALPAMMMDSSPARRFPAGCAPRASLCFAVVRWFLGFAALAALPLGASSASAQSASASLSDASAELGQAVEYRITVSNARSEMPRVPRVDGLKIAYVGPQRSTQISGGSNGIQVVELTVYRFVVEPQREGRFTIPGQDLQLDSGTVRVQPVAFNVAKSAAAPNARSNPQYARFVELAPAKKSAYVGESVPLDVRAYFGAGVRLVQIDPNPILSGEGFTVQKFGQPALDVQLVEDNQFHVVTYKSVVAGIKTGTLSIGPVEINPVIQLPRDISRRRSSGIPSPFDDDPFSRDPFGMFNAAPKQEKLRSDAVNFEIKPLPPNAPANFSGAIGQFKLEAEAEPGRVQAGDPVTVRLHLSGNGNFDRANAPALLEDRNLRPYPPSAKFKADDELGLSGVKTFEQVVVAQSGRTSLPGYSFSYFDPVSGRYITLETPPLPVKVEGNAALPPTPTPAAAAADNNKPAASATPKPSPAAPQDILYIRNDLGRTVDGEAFLPLYRRRVFWAAQGVPLALLLGCGVWGLRRAQLRNTAARRAAEAQRQQAQLVRALQSEKTGRRDFYSAAARLAQLRAAASAGRSGDDHLSASEVCAAKRLDPQTAASVEEIFHRHDELAYSGAFAAQEPVPQAERRGVLATLETIEKR